MSSLWRVIVEKLQKDLYWTKLASVKTPEDEVKLIFETTDFTFLEKGKLPNTLQEYEDFECGRLRIERCAEIMMQDNASLSADSVGRIKIILGALERALEKVIADTTLDWNTIDLAQAPMQEGGGETDKAVEVNYKSNNKDCHIKGSSHIQACGVLGEGDEKPHTVVTRYLGQGKGQVETCYYGDAMPPKVNVNNWSDLRVTKASPSEDKQTLSQWLVSWFKPS